MIGRIHYLKNNTVVVISGDEEITYVFATFGERFVARLLDVLIVVIPSVCFPLIGSWLYFALQQSGPLQATVGQRTMDINVLSMDGQKVNFGQATGRYFGNYLNMLTFCVGYFLFFTNDKSQCLHDIVSQCIVVREVNRKKISVDEKYDVLEEYTTPVNGRQ